MARRGNKEETPVDTEAQAEANDNTESNDQVNTDEAQDNTGTESNEQADQKSEEKSAPAEPDLTEFKEAIEQALTDGDDDTGVLPVAAQAAVSDAYRKLDGQKAKNLAKALLDDGVKASIIGSNLPHARSYTEMRDAVNKVTAKKATDKVPADPKEAAVTRLASLRLAHVIVMDTLPDTLNADEVANETTQLAESLTEDVEKYKAWVANEAEDKGEAPEVNPVVKSAFKLAQGKAAGAARKSGTGGSSSGERHSTAKHIEEYFADKEAGHFAKISEIANFKSAEYGDDHPSQGAVSARLFPPNGGKCTISGVEPVQKDDSTNQPRGARKAAA